MSGNPSGTKVRVTATAAEIETYRAWLNRKLRDCLREPELPMLGTVGQVILELRELDGIVPSDRCAERKD